MLWNTQKAYYLQMAWNYTKTKQTNKNKEETI